MMMKKRGLLVASIVALFAVALLAYGSIQPQSTEGTEGKKIVRPKKGDMDTLVVGTENEPAGLDIINQTTQGAMASASPIFETLIKLSDETGAFEPWLATEWKWLNDTTLAMTIRDDVVFHNGEKFTAEDVKYTISRFPKGSATAAIYASFDGENSKVVDDTHIEIVFKEPCAPALALLSSPSANIVNKKYVEEVGDAHFNRNPIGTGPFMMAAWKSGESITYERFEKYWGRKSSFKRMLFRPIVDVTARGIAMENADIDVQLAMLPSFTKRLTDNEVPGVQLYRIPSVYFYWLSMNNNFKPFQDIRVRQAIAHTMDTAGVCEASWNVNSRVLGSICPMTCWGYKEHPPFELNIEKAKKLMAEAGYAGGFDVRFVVSENINASNAGEAVQAMLSQIGINCKLEKYTTSTWQQMVLEGTAEMSFGGLITSTGDISQAVAHLASTSPYVSYRWNDPKVDDLIKRGMQELDTDKRYQIYAELQDHVLDNVYDIPIFNLYYTYATRDYIDGFIPHSRMLMDWTNITILQ